MNPVPQQLLLKLVLIICLLVPLPHNYDENGETKCGICEQTLNTEQIEDQLKAHEIQEQENDLSLQQLPSSSSNAAAAIHSSAALTAEDSLSEDGDVADEEEFECVICRQKLNAAEVADHAEAHNIQHQENEPCTTTASSSDNLPTCTTSTYDENGETKCGICEQTLNTEQIEDHLKAHEKFKSKRMIFHYSSLPSLFFLQCSSSHT